MAAPLLIVWNAIGMSLWVVCGTYLHTTPKGLELKSRNGKRQRLILWQDLKHLEKVYQPPFHTYKIILITGEHIAIDFLGDGFLFSELEARGVQCIERDRRIHDCDRDSV